MTVYIDYDVERWLYVPNAFPWESFRDEEQWASTVAKEFGRGGLRRPPKQLLAWLHDYLLGAVRSNHAGTIRFAHIPNLQAPNTIVDVYDLPTNPDVPLADLTHENQSPAVRPPEVVPFLSPHLGEGVKSTRWIAGDDDSLIRATNWVWRTAERDIVVLTGMSDTALAEAFDPVLDEFARAVRLPAPGEAG
jgi:hypothetical protein